MTAPMPLDRSFTSGTLALHVLDWGNQEARPLILLHHINSQAHTWDDFALAMSQDYHVVALDIRGHGESQWAGEGNYSVEHQASDVAALVENLDLRDAVVLGGSIGGRVALVFAGQNPEKVAGLVIEDVGAERPAQIASGFQERVRTGDPQYETVEEAAHAMRGRNTRASLAVYQRNARYATYRLPNGKLGLRRDPAISADFVVIDLWHYVARIQCPFLLIRGAESTIVSDEARDRFLRTVSQSHEVTIPEAGHIVVHDQPQRFEAVVREFLQRYHL